MSNFMNAFDRAANCDILHYGVKGMQWGVVNEYQPVGNTPAAQPQNQPQQQAQQPPQEQEQQNQMTPEQEEKAREMAEKIAAEDRKAARKKALKIAGLVTAGVAVVGLVGYSIYRNRDAIRERNAERKQRFDDRIDARNDLRNARYDRNHVNKNYRYEKKTARIQGRADVAQARADRATYRRDTTLDIRAEKRMNRIDRRDETVGAYQYARKYRARLGVEEKNRHHSEVIGIRTDARENRAINAQTAKRLDNFADEQILKSRLNVGVQKGRSENIANVPVIDKAINKKRAKYGKQITQNADRAQAKAWFREKDFKERVKIATTRFSFLLGRITHDDMEEEDYLCHSGVVGMKWGVRKDEQQAIDDDARVEAAAQEAAQKIEDADKQKVRRAVMIGAAVGLGTATVAIVGGLIAKKTKNAPERRRTEGVRDVLNEAGAEKGAKLYNMVHK